MAHGDSHAFAVDVEWSDFVEVHLLWPLWAQLALTLLFGAVLGPLYRRCLGPGSFRSFLKVYVGSRDRPEVARPRCLVFLCMLQMLSSLVTVVVWARNTYLLGVQPWAHYVILTTGILDSLYWFVSRLRGGFSVLELWSLSSIIDAVTIVPTICGALARVGIFFETPEGMDWITLRFLRAYFILIAYQQILATGVFKHSNRLLQMVILTALRIYCLVIPMSGLLLTLEVLGDPPVMADTFIETPGGDHLSFVMMCNWVIISVVTLGSGAFHPKTVMAQWAWSFFVVTAVGYVFYIQFAFGQAWLATREGSGSYKPGKRKHIVVFLQVQGYATQVSSVVLGLLSEALSTSTSEPWPDIVFFCENYWDATSTTDAKAKTLNHFLKEKNFGSKASSHIHFIVGQTCQKEDLERAAVADAALTYVVPDINTNTPERDDELNIFLALSLKRFYPDVRLRLMLLLPQSKDLAVQSGIMMERCFSVRELKAHMLAQNVRCHGMLPMITCFFKSVDEEQEALLTRGRDKSKSLDSSASDACRASSSGGTVSPRATGPGKLGLLGAATDYFAMPEWVAEYVGGVSRGVFGFELSPEFADLCFSELVVAVHRACGAVIVAVLIEGSIQVCPQDSHWHPLSTGQVCFAIADSEEALDAVRDPEYEATHWKETLLNTRDVLAKRTALEGPHVAAARLLGKQLQDVLLKPDDPLSLENEDFERQHTDDSKGSGGESASQAGALVRNPGRKSSKCSATGSVCTGMTGAQFTDVMTKAEAAECESLAAVDAVRRLRRQVGESQDLVVVAVGQGEVWQQVRAFVSSLRAQYQPVFRPIVIIAPTEPPPRLLHGLKERVLTLVGSCLKVKELMEAGVLEAGSVVVMAGEVPVEEMKRAPQLKDARVCLVSRMLECWCGVSHREVFTTYELLDSTSVSDLPQLMAKPAVDLHSFLAEKAFDEDGAKDDDEDWERKSVGSMNGRKGQAEAGSPTEGMWSSDNLLRSSQAAVSSITFNMRFAAGQVLTPEIWGCMLGRMYYNPAVIELAEALVMPQRRGQRAFPWQIKPPDRYYGKAYEELVIDLALGVWAHPDSSKRPEIGDHCMPKEGPVVPMALYRKRCEFHEKGDAAEGTGGNHYLVLGPTSRTILQEGDWLLVLGSRRFGRKAMTMGLLRGSKPSKNHKDAEPLDPVKTGQMLAAELAAEVAADQAEDSMGVSSMAVCEVKPPDVSGVGYMAGHAPPGLLGAAHAAGGAQKPFAAPCQAHAPAPVPPHGPGRPRQPGGPWCGAGSAPPSEEEDAKSWQDAGALSGLWQEVRQVVKSWGGLEGLLDCPVGTGVPVPGYHVDFDRPGGPAPTAPGPGRPPQLAAMQGQYPGQWGGRAGAGTAPYAAQPAGRTGGPPESPPPPPPATPPRRDGWQGRAGAQEPLDAAPRAACRRGTPRRVLPPLALPASPPRPGRTGSPEGNRKAPEGRQRHAHWASDGDGQDNS